MDLFIDLYSECDIDSVRNNNCVNVFINSGFVRIIIYVFRYNNCVTIFVGCYPNCVYNAICINNNNYSDRFIRLFSNCVIIVNDFFSNNCSNIFTVLKSTRVNFIINIFRSHNIISIDLYSNVIIVTYSPTCRVDIFIDLFSNS